MGLGGRGAGVERAAWDVFSRSGQCVQFRGQCVQFLAECVHFRGECVHFGGRCVQFSAVRLGWGDGARTEGEIPRLRCAALGMTEAVGEVRSGCVRGRDGRSRAGMIMALGPS